MIENDKSSVPSVALGTIGKFLEGNHGRDAIHMAVFSARARVDLKRGQRISVDGENAYPDENGPGIVDPFIPDHVKPGERFWMFLKPRVVTSLRHVWEHPAFDNEVAKIESKPEISFSEEWLRTWSSEADHPFSFEAMMDKLANDVEDKCIHTGSDECYGEFSDELYEHLEIYLGKTIKKKDRAEYFSCAC